MTTPDIAFDISLKQFFFDRLKVQNALDKAERRELSRTGAFLRKRARSSLRRRKKTLVSGQTPSVHSKDNTASLKNILFAYDPARHSVVVGPLKLNQVNQQTDGSSIPIPSLMEFGGTVRIDEEQYKDDPKGQWFRRNHNYSAKPWKRYRTRTANYAPRPFMGPALAKEIEAGTIRDQWVGALNAA